MMRRIVRSHDLWITTIGGSCAAADENFGSQSRRDGLSIEQGAVGVL